MPPLTPISTCCSHDAYHSFLYFSCLNMGQVVSASGRYTASSVVQSKYMFHRLTVRAAKPVDKTSTTTMSKTCTWVRTQTIGTRPLSSGRVSERKDVIEATSGSAPLPHDRCVRITIACQPEGLESIVLATMLFMARCSCDWSCRRGNSRCRSRATATEQAFL